MSELHSLAVHLSARFQCSLLPQPRDYISQAAGRSHDAEGRACDKAGTPGPCK